MQDFNLWLDAQKAKGLQDIKFVVGGDTSDVSVSKAKDEIVLLHKMAEASITCDFPMATNYESELTELNKALDC